MHRLTLRNRLRMPPLYRAILPIATCTTPGPYLRRERTILLEPIRQAGYLLFPFLDSRLPAGEGDLPPLPEVIVGKTIRSRPGNLPETQGIHLELKRIDGLGDLPGKLEVHQFQPILSFQSAVQIPVATASYWVNSGLVTVERRGRGRVGHTIGIAGLRELVTVMELRNAGISLASARTQSNVF